ncbi:MAG TPA: BTAD domain-containing putative transcriptional regulator [Candidatus Baltobacteraceae bacterium]|jgi:hypothetical protein|nr:BTAD domain-containing putative transcriptional regulator [Candidatus Baltobacteraceae bacterium]
MEVPIVPAALPRLPAFALERRRLLDRYTRGSLTVIAAPSGYGKTVLAVQIAAQNPAQFAYVPVRIGEDDASIASRLRAATEGGRTPIIDDAHLAAPSGRHAIRTFLRTLDSAIDAIVCTRSCDGVVEHRTLFDGSVSVVDDADLAFTAAEVRALCERFQVAFKEVALAEFMQRTASWPMAVCGALRAAGERSLDVGAAIDEWYRLHSAGVARFIADECARVPDGAPFLAHVHHPGPVTPEELAAWHACGLFVVRAGKEYRVIPVAYGVFGNEPGLGAANAPAMQVHLLRHDVAAAIGDVRIRWVRHKDAQLVKYLILKSGAPATRTELMEIFWPGRDRNIAAQNLRTTCSNIRRAIRAIVGAESVDRYFESSGDIRVSATVISDIESFTTEISRGRLALAAGDARTARAHFKAARDIYRADLLTGMPACGFEDLASSLRHDFGEAVHRLRTLPDFSEPRANAS